MKLNSGGSLSDFTSVLFPLGRECFTGDLPDSKGRIFFIFINLKVPSARPDTGGDAKC